ncbi:MAG: hypothetical protein KUG79_03700 [Pseudomonadales bacterium]|nr:hypothetical protein [Pseudomonadales bacterium]
MASLDIDLVRIKKGISWACYTCASCCTFKQGRIMNITYVNDIAGAR